MDWFTFVLFYLIKYLVQVNSYCHWTERVDEIRRVTYDIQFTLLNNITYVPNRGKTVTKVKNYVRQA